MATIRELITRLRKQAQVVAGAVRSACTAIACFLSPARVVVPAFPAAAGLRNAMDAGKPYRLTSGHAPVFVLYTYFGLR